MTSPDKIKLKDIVDAANSITLRGIFMLGVSILFFGALVFNMYQFKENQDLKDNIHLCQLTSQDKGYQYRHKIDSLEQIIKHQTPIIKVVTKEKNNILSPHTQQKIDSCNAIITVITENYSDIIPSDYIWSCNSQSQEPKCLKKHKLQALLDKLEAYAKNTPIEEEMNIFISKRRPLKRH